MMRFADFARTVGLYGSANLLSAAVPIILLPILTRHIDPAGYGLIGVFQVLLGLFTALTGLGVHGLITNRFFESSQEQLGEFIGNCYIVLCLSAGPLIVLCFFFGKQFEWLTMFPGEWLLVVIFAASCQFIMNCLSVVYQARQSPNQYFAFHASFALVNVTLTWAFVAWFEWGWRGRVLAHLIASLGFASWGTWVLRSSGLLRFRRSNHELKDALRFGLPLTFHSISNAAHMVVNRLILAHFCGLGAVGLYTLGHQIGSVVALVERSVNLAYVPWLFSKLQKCSDNCKREIVRLTYVYFVLLGIGALCLGIAGPTVIKKYTSLAYREAGEISFWIAIAGAFEGMYKTVAAYIFFGKRTELLAMITLVGSLVSISLTAFLTASFGVIGASVASAAYSALYFMATWIIADKVVKMPWAKALADRCRGVRGD